MGNLILELGKNQAIVIEKDNTGEVKKYI